MGFGGHAAGLYFVAVQHFRQFNIAAHNVKDFLTIFRQQTEVNSVTAGHKKGAARSRPVLIFAIVSVRS
jgi:hypothetical protein